MKNRLRPPVSIQIQLTTKSAAFCVNRYQQKAKQNLKMKTFNDNEDEDTRYRRSETQKRE